ncbi:golgin subfamily A member 2 [Agrilus planipennis]|uniref:Golgin subfamily A member 2 n=1 Tax=Agrilus planipennis TaxID=224129 RepID=A0A1W4XK95_AGRPL|nr:golgin subfamily A member 2 [Agrilus planipennis]
MSDVTKAQKLAAARKKLKEFKQKHKGDIKEKETEKGIEICESLGSSTHSSLNGSILDTGIHPKEFFNVEGSHNNVENNKDTLIPTLSSCNYAEGESKKLPYEIQNEDNVTEFQHFNLISFPQTHPSIFDDSINMTMQSQQIVNNSEELNIIQLQPDKLQNLETVAAENVNQVNAEKMHLSGTESLKQLSSQINNLIKESDSYSQADIVCNSLSGLEKRNQELAAQLQEIQIEKETLKTQIEEREIRIRNLIAENENSKIELQTKLNRELGPLKEQLQTHAQTLGILVAEKTELSTSLSQSQLTLKQKIAECEELQGRLRTSRGRVADLEKELNFFRQEKAKMEHLINSDEMEGRNKELSILKERLNEVNQDLLEIKEKYNSKSEENRYLQNQIQDLSHQLSLAQLRLQQVTAGEKHQNDVEIEALAQEKIQLEKRVKELSESLAATTAERDQSSVHYQHYTEQLNEQVNNLASRLQNLTQENERLSSREQELVRHIGELEKRLQNLQDERLNEISCSNGSTVVTDENVLMDLQQLRHDKQILSDKCQQLLEDKRLLEEEIHFHEEKERDFSEQLEQARENRPDLSKLMASIESDKVAAARAVSQNAELKAQLEEMQQAFIKASNDKMELMEKLTSSKYEITELQEKCEYLESQLQKLDNALVIKDQELLKERENVENLNKQLFQYDQLNDRLRHYEAKNSGLEMLQNEMLQTRQQLQTLQAENLHLKELIRSSQHTALEQINEIEYNKLVETNNIINNEAVKNEKVKKQEILIIDRDDNKKETSDDQLLSKYLSDIEELKQKNKELELQVYRTSKDKLSEVNDNNNDSYFGSSEVMLNKEEAMKHLEEKFLQTMEEVANLTEEKHRLEHLVTQLQSETETIGEYVTLYQHQRAILQQRTLEKDEQLKKLQEDRTEVKSKLELLNLLVKKLIEEKGTTVTSELLRQQHKANDNKLLCSEHAYIQEEINKIRAENKLDSSNDSIESVDHGGNSTAQQIISLLSEIKTSSLVQSPDMIDNFHPCGWCSGQLITI